MRCSERLRASRPMRSRPTAFPAHRAWAAPHSAVAELGVVRRSRATPENIAHPMTHSEANVTSKSSGSESLVVRTAVAEASASALAAGRTRFECSALPGFGHAATLAAMSGVTPICASLSLPTAQRRSTSSVRESVRSSGSFLPAPQPPSAALPSSVQGGPPLAARRSAAVTFSPRFAATRQRWRKSERTPRLKFEVQHWLVANEALIGCFVSMSFSWSVV